MPKFNVQEILSSNNPYELFNKEVSEAINDQKSYQTLGDILVDHQKILDGLDLQKQNKLARKIVSKCPQNELKKLRRALKALSVLNHQSQAFHTIIFPLYQLKASIFGLLDEKNNAPHTILLEAQSLFRKERSFFKSIIKGHEARIAERLAFLTPPKQYNEVIQCVHTTFAKTDLSRLIHEAFTLQQNIQYLLGERPELFFISQTFNREYCFLFSKLFISIKGQEKQIGLKLAKISSNDDRNKVISGLKLLTTSNYNQADPFVTILDAMDHNFTTAKNPYSFSRALTSPKDFKNKNEPSQISRTMSSFL
jgi:hypothetical protein